MINVGYKKLECGPLLVYSQDQTKNQSYAEISIKYGGQIKRVEANGEVIEIKEGLAHLLEHIISENNPTGNMLSYMRENYIDYNAVTSREYTVYYMNIVLDFNKHFEELLKLVNIKAFTKEKIENIKKPVLEEIKRGLDRPYRRFGEMEDECIYNGIKFKNCLGLTEDVKDMSYELISKVYDIFYQPDNQIIFITGNFDLDKTINQINDFYKKLDKKKIDYKILDEEEKVAVSKKSAHIIEKEFDELVSITYKVDISKLSPKDRVKGTFYLNHFLKYNFSDESSAFEIVQKNDLSRYSFETSVSLINKDIVSISVSLYTNKVEEFKKIVNDVFDKLPYDEEMFDLWKRSTIIDILERNQSPKGRGCPYLDNIKSFNYFEEDKVSDIEEYNIKDYFTFMKNLDYSNYCIVNQTKE